MGSLRAIETVMVIDDDRNIVEALRFMLMKKGYKVTTAADGELGIEKVRLLTPDLIILDIMMPRADGYKVLETIRADARLQNIPVILLTARRRNEDLMAGYRNGADYFMTKPFSEKQILAGIALISKEVEAEKSAIQAGGAKVWNIT